MKYSKSIRQEVFVKYVCGYTPKEIARETGIRFATIYRWVNFMKQLELSSNICSDTYYPSQSQEEERDNVQILQ